MAGRRLIDTLVRPWCGMDMLSSLMLYATMELLVDVAYWIPYGRGGAKVWDSEEDDERVYRVLMLGEAARQGVWPLRSHVMDAGLNFVVLGMVVE